MLSNQILNQLHNEFNLTNDLEYYGVLIGENTDFKSIKVEDDGEYVKNYILVYNKKVPDMNLWCVILNKNTFELTLEYMHNLPDCMAIANTDIKPILDWIYHSFTYENIIDFINRLMN